MARNQDAEFVIDDPEELSQKTRIRELLQRRKDVLDARSRSKDEELLGGVDHMDAIGHYQNHVETLILDLWTKFTSVKTSDDTKTEPETDGGQSIGEYYLYAVPIETVQVPPPPEMPCGTDLAPSADTPEAKPETIKGLKWFVENDPFVTKSFTVRSFNPPGERTFTNTVPIPRSVLDKAVANCFEFMDEVGIDADFDDEGEPIIRDFDQSGEEPNATFEHTAYSGDPEI